MLFSFISISLSVTIRDIHYTILDLHTGNFF